MTNEENPIGSRTMIDHSALLTENKEIAIYQNRLAVGGRTKVILDMVSVLNEYGIEPTLYCLGRTATIEEIESAFGTRTSCSVRSVGRDFDSVGSPILLNAIMHRFSSEYDVLVNSNNTLLCAPALERTIAYVHFPLICRVGEALLSEGERWYKKVGVELRQRVMAAWEPWGQVEGRVAANSIFTGEITARCQRLTSGQVTSPEVIYPQIQIKRSEEQYQEKKLCTATTDCLVLGRYSQAKDQKTAVRLAKRLPNLNFVICGVVTGKHGADYFEQCQQLAEELNVENVDMIDNASKDEVCMLQRDASIIFHAAKNEPFGLAVAESIAKGCVAVVHNSGGVKEMAQDGRLQYDTVAEAAEILKTLVSDRRVMRTAWQKQIAFVQECSREQFGASIVKLMARAIQETGGGGAE